MPSLMIVFKLSEDESELLRCWRLLGSAPTCHREAVLMSIQQLVQIYGCEEEEREEALDSQPLGPVVHCAAVSDLQGAEELAVGDKGDVPIL